MMPDQFEKWLKVLGLAPGASEQAIREAYRDLVKVWHPDRFGSDARLREKAEERLRDLNNAFAHLQNYRPARFDDDASGSGSFRRAPPAPETGRRLAISGRMAATLSVAAMVAAVAVWLVLPAARDQRPPLAASPQPEATGSRPRIVPASRSRPQT